MQKKYNILLIGESCNDEYHYGNCSRLCAEAPVPVFKYESQEIRPGMAANVKENLLAFGGINIDFVTNNPTQLIKRRFVDSKSNQLLLREDIENSLETVEFPNTNQYDAIVFSDYCKGLLDPKKVKKLCRNFQGPIFVDSKNPDLSMFENCIIKINNDEEKLLKKLPKNCELIVTMGKNGARWKNFTFDAPKADVFDVTGAGDVFLATLCYFYLHTKQLQSSIQPAVNLATKSVQHMGVYVLTSTDINSFDI